jgi:GntR family transcriptional repressor for pyruvate dehydrogenase complex
LKRSPRHKVYQEVARQLERRITEELKPGDLLPSERELVRILGVSRDSVRNAIRTLELMGLLEPRQGVGTVVCGPRCETQ